MSYRNTLADLQTFCEAEGAKHVNEANVDRLSAFRLSRMASQRKELEHLRAFFRFCVAREWIQGNPAVALKPPRETSLPTLPFERDEIERTLTACDQIENNYRESAARARKRTRALILLLLYSGLGISDVAVRERIRLDRKTRKLLIRTMKTGTPLYVRVPQSVIDALDALPIESNKHFFWTGNGKPSSVIGSLRRSFECVLKLAEVDGHQHRFRDTFAVRLLEHDTPVRTVQLLLGHTSVQTTERHYAPFVKSTQKLLDAATDHLDFGESVGPLPQERGQHVVRNAKRAVLPLST